MIVTPNEDDVFRAVRSFLQDLLPPVDDATGFVVVAGQINRVPEPKDTNYVVFWPLRMPRLSTNVEKMAALGLEFTVEQSVECVVQLDVHGPEAFNNASVISTMWRSSYAVDFFTNPTIAPLFADDPRNMVFSPGGEQQYEDRYIIEAHLQVNQTVTTVAQSARELTLGITSVETNPENWPNTTVTVEP